MFIEDQEEEKSTEEESKEETSEEGSTNSVNEEEGAEGEPETQTFKIDDKEYTAEELKGFVEDAKNYKQLHPEYTRATQELARLKEAEEKIKEDSNSTEEDKELANVRKEAFELLKPDIEKMLETVISQREKDSTQKSEMIALEKELDGKDGRPKFVMADVAKFAIDNNLGGKPMDIYEIMHKEELKDFYRKEGAQGKSKTFSEKTSKGVHLPKGKDYSKMSVDEIKLAGVEYLKSLHGEDED